MTTKLHKKRQGQECGAVQEASVVLRGNAVSAGKTPPIPMPTRMQASGMLVCAVGPHWGNLSLTAEERSEIIQGRGLSVNARFLQTPDPHISKSE